MLFSVIEIFLLIKFEIIKIEIIINDKGTNMMNEFLEIDLDNKNKEKIKIPTANIP
jgi:hypothetical protein